MQQETGRYLRAGRPLTYEALRLHLLGKHTLGTYVIDEQGTCRFAVFDADSDDGMEVLAGVQARLHADGVISYLEASRRGAHLWVFLSRLLPASQLRRWLLPYCPAGVEFYPKQDEGVGYGSLIRLPLGVHRLSHCRYWFFSWLPDSQLRVYPLARSLSESLSWLSSVRRAEVPETIPTSEPSSDQQAGADTHTSLAKNATTTTPFTRETIRAWCVSQDPLRIIGRYVQLDRRGLGCCPFGEHHAMARTPIPRFGSMLLARTTASCWYCYVWQRGGTLFDFLCLWHGLDAVLWQRILKGSVMSIFDVALWQLLSEVG